MTRAPTEPNWYHTLSFMLAYIPGLLLLPLPGLVMFLQWNITGKSAYGWIGGAILATWLGAMVAHRFLPDPEPVEEYQARLRHFES